MRSQLALITFLDGDSGHVPSHPIVLPPGQPVYPDQGLPPIPPGYWGGVAPPYPSHPIAPGGQPPQPSHPIFYPPYPSTGPGFPTHPIAPGGPPPGYWGGVAPPHPDNTLPPGSGSGSAGPGYPGQLPSFDPTNGGWVYSFVPGYGWMWSWVPNPNPPRPDNTLPGPQPEVNPLT